MTRTTKAQRKALKRVFDRAPQALTYRKFRALAQPTFGCDGAIALPWCGMWLCIERDGYTHS
jgi:hypothetical protein